MKIENYLDCLHTMRMWPSNYLEVERTNIFGAHFPNLNINEAQQKLKHSKELSLESCVGLKRTYSPLQDGKAQQEFKQIIIFVWSLV